MGDIKTIDIKNKNYPKLLKEEALHIDKIIEKTKLSVQKVASTLAILEIKGKVKNLGGNIYAVSNSRKSR